MQRVHLWGQLACSAISPLFPPWMRLSGDRGPRAAIHCSWHYQPKLIVHYLLLSKLCPLPPSLPLLSLLLTIPAFTTSSTSSMRCCLMRPGLPAGPCSPDQGSSLFLTHFECIFKSRFCLFWPPFVWKGDGSAKESSEISLDGTVFLFAGLKQQGMFYVCWASWLWHRRVRLSFSSCPWAQGNRQKQR